MKRFWIAMAAVGLLMCAFMTNALASVPATPNQRLAFRTGPNTKYVELYSLPQSTSIQAIEYERGNGVTWVLVEFSYQGEKCRAYTGLKRMSVNGSIPWADHIDETVWIGEGGQVCAAPTSRGAYRGYVEAGDQVTLLDYEGDYAYIEFSDGGIPSRGYVPDWMLDDSGDDDDYYDYYDYEEYDDYDDGEVETLYSVPARPNQELAFRTGPNTKYAWMYHMPQSTSLQAIEYEEGNGVTWVLVEFSRNGRVSRGYTGLKRMSVRGDIPWASFINERTRVIDDGTVYAAPDDSAERRGRISAGTSVTLLRYEGYYAYIEYSEGGTPSRGYVQDWMIEGY